MRKENNKLSLKKVTIARLDLNNIKGGTAGATSACLPGITDFCVVSPVVER